MIWIRTTHCKWLIYFLRLFQSIDCSHSLFPLITNLSKKWNIFLLKVISHNLSCADCLSMLCFTYSSVPVDVPHTSDLIWTLERKLPFFWFSCFWAVCPPGLWSGSLQGQDGHLSSPWGPPAWWHFLSKAVWGCGNENSYQLWRQICLPSTSWAPWLLCTCPGGKFSPWWEQGQKGSVTSLLENLKKVSLTPKSSWMRAKLSWARPSSQLWERLSLRCFLRDHMPLFSALT